MSTSLNVILKRFAVIFLVVGVLFAIMELFAYDVIKVDWPSFMEIQPSHRAMIDPLPVPAQSIPIDGPVSIPNMGAPSNPVPADQASVARGAELFHINCTACHGDGGKGNGPIAAFIVNKPADLTSPLVKALSDGQIFLTMSNGVPGKMPALNENLLVRERWDIVNYIRTLQKQQ
ncbi:MAG TPA: c-type cytochrome [Anaerolineales bacterium]|jgi:mono/diheme cytochrome c family protein|nr:c-type cytochrome [Anaerolineales bacterium]